MTVPRLVVGGVGGGVDIAGVRVPTSPGCGSPSVCVFVARCVRAWCLCWCVCRSFVAAWVWVCLLCVLVCVCVRVWVCHWGRLGLAAGVGVGVVGVCPGWSLVGWGPLAAVVCGLWCVVCGVWCAAVVCWWGCGWCVVWLVSCYSWRRFLCATPRHSWLGFAAGGGGRPSPLLAEGSGCGSSPLLARFGCRRWWVFLSSPGCGPRVRFPATPGWGPLAAVVCCVWCVVCGVCCAAVLCWWGSETQPGVAGSSTQEPPPGVARDQPHHTPATMECASWGVYVGDCSQGLVNTTKKPKGVRDAVVEDLERQAKAQRDWNAALLEDVNTLMHGVKKERQEENG